MANVIIGIHGLGNKPPRVLLEYWWKQAMREGLETHQYKTTLPRFELVYWADIIYDKPLNAREKNVDSPYYLDERYVPASKNFKEDNHDTRKKIVDFLGDQVHRIFLNDDLSLNYSFIADSIVNKYFKELELYYTNSNINHNGNPNKTKDLIQSRLLQVLEKYKTDNIMLVSHSMGTIIAFDVLSWKLSTFSVHSFITMGSPLGLPMVVSKIAAEQNQKLNGESHMVSPEGVSKFWYNFSDITDKVAFNYKLADDFSENSLGIKPADFLVVNNYEINDNKNPHKSFGYLRTREFSKILNDFIQTRELSIWEQLLAKLKQFFDRLRRKRIKILPENFMKE
ncbi:MAG: hypothetical protein JEZ03_07170 [Bacteroidales bacterium]|nr:hypothetical protein [Bacteroidales bacterium]